MGILKGPVEKLNNGRCFICECEFDERFGWATCLDEDNVQVAACPVHRTALFEKYLEGIEPKERGRWDIFGAFPARRVIMISVENKQAEMERVSEILGAYCSTVAGLEYGTSNAYERVVVWCWVVPGYDFAEVLNLVRQIIKTDKHVEKDSNA